MPYVVFVYFDSISYSFSFAHQTCCPCEETRGNHFYPSLRSPILINASWESSGARWGGTTDDTEQNKMLGKYAETSIIQRSGLNVAKSSVSLLLIATHKTRPSSVSKFRSVRCARYFDYSYRLTVTTATANTTTTITITTIVSRKTKTKCLIIRNMIDICYNNDGISMSNFVLLSPSSSKHSIPFDVRQIDIVSVGAYGWTFSHASNFTFILLLGWSIWWWSADNA